MDSSNTRPKIPKSFEDILRKDIIKKQTESGLINNSQVCKTSSSRKISKQDDTSFMLPNAKFQEKISNRSSRNSKDSATQEDTLRQSYDSQRRNKRELIYDNESFKQTFEQQAPTTAQTNNDIFSMVFLSRPLYDESKESVSTSSSFSKNKLKSQDDFMKITDFAIGRKLGSGKFGQVFIARHKRSGFICAIKRINKKNVDSKLIVQLIRQIKIQSFLSHPNIVKLYTFFSNESYIYLVQELCYSGQLYLFLKRKRKIPQDLTRNIVQQICRAVDYMHQNEIIHRDLKPQNIIFHNGLIKICDFGWSISTNTMRQTFCGTPLYVSPELLKRKNYNNKIDVWSIGILTYELLFGRVPFEITTERDFIKIVEEEIKFSKATSISDEAKDFILICLAKDPRDRYTVPELLEHHFLIHADSAPIGQMY